MIRDSQDEFTDYVPQFLGRPIRLFALWDLLIRLPDPCDEPGDIICESLKIGLVFSDILPVLTLAEYHEEPEMHTYLNRGDNF